MKELSIEEKAKRYDEAIERAKNFIENGDESERTIAESIFAGIMDESEDERIRKDMIETIKKEAKDFPSSVIAEKSHTWLAWLEKQGEQKSSWSKEDEIGLADAMWAIKQARTIAKDENDMGNLWYAERWLKSFKKKSTVKII